MTQVVTYKPYPTMARFHNDVINYTFRYIAGPPGSGKSVGCFWELMTIALRQEPTPQGVRPTKFGVIRSTYGELERTTLETMKMWLPAKFTKVVHSKPIKVHTRLPLPDGTIADIQFDLIAIESPYDLGKLDSYEATAIWLNEMTGLPAALVGKAGERTGRYPPSNMWGDLDEQGNPRNHCTYSGVIGDYNYPPKDHWLVSFLHENTLPESTMLYEQPAALIEEVEPTTGAVTYSINPLAENLSNLDRGQKYMRDLSNYQALGEWDLINTRLLCRYGRAGGDGKAVFTNFDREFHVAEDKLEVLSHTHTLVSIDTSGIHPCALFWQHVRGAWHITDGVYGEEMGLQEFVEDVLVPLITLRYPGCDILCVCDPANARNALTATSPTETLEENGLKAILAPTNNFKDRLRASERLLSKTDRGRLIISPHVALLIDALDGGYQYRKLKATGITDQFSTSPLKNKYSHWADAFQYGALHLVSGTIDDDEADRARRVAQASIRRGRR